MKRADAGYFLRLHRTGLAVFFLAATIAVVPLVVRNPYQLGILNLVGLNVIVVLGLNLFIGYAGQISLGQSAFMGLGAYGSAILTTAHGWSPWLAMAVTAAVTALTALVIGVPTLRLSSHYLAMATLGFNLVTYNILVQWDRVTGGPSGLAGIPPLSLFGWEVGSDARFHYLVWGFALASLMLSLNLVRSGVGRGLAAVAGDETAAAALGIDVRRAKVKVFILSAVMASLAGSLYAHYFRFVSPDTFGIFASIDLVAMVVVGGIGSIWGTLFGVGLMTPLPQLLEFFQNYRDIIHGLILVVILLVLPQGLVTGLAEVIRLRFLRRRATVAQEGP